MVVPLRAGNRRSSSPWPSATRAPTQSATGWTTSADSLRDHGDPHVRGVVLDHVQVPFRLALKVAVDPAYETATRCWPRSTPPCATAFAFPRRGPSAPTVEQSQVIAVGHTVPGVLAVDLDRLYDERQRFPRQHRLVAPAAP